MVSVYEEKYNDPYQNRYADLKVQDLTEMFTVTSIFNTRLTHKNTAQVGL